MKNIIIYISIAIYGLAGIAQTPEPKRYNFTHYTEESGLLSYQVNSTVQDDEGFIWIGTNEGLQRYDGIRYKNFVKTEKDTSSLLSKAILQVLIDSNSNFWVLTQDGRVGVFDTKSFTMKEAHIKVKNEIFLGSLTMPKKLIADDNGSIFLLISGEELLTYEKDKHEFSASHNFFIPKPDWKIIDFVPQPGTNKYWMCLSDYGLAVFDRNTGQLSHNGNNIAQDKLIEYYKTTTNPNKLFFDGQGRAWHVGTDEGLPYIYCYDLKKGKPVFDKYGFLEQVPKYHEVHQFLEQRDGSIWISGINIFAKYLEKEMEFQQVYNGYVDDRSIEFIVITSLNEGRERNIWVTTGNNGIFRFNPAEEFFSSIEHTSKLIGKIGTGAPITFMHDLDGSILVGVWNDHLYRYDRDFRPVPLNIKGFSPHELTTVVRLCQSRQDKIIWMAVKNGIYKYDQQKRQIQFYELPMLRSRIREIVEDKEGNLWLGLQEHGVYKWDVKKGKIDFKQDISHFLPIPEVRVNKIMVDGAGMVWVGTHTKGLYVIDPKTNSVALHFYDKGTNGLKLPDKMVSTVLEYNDSLVAIGTSANVFLYNRLYQKLSVLGHNKSISGFIQSMEKDGDGYLWVSSTAGLTRVNLNNRVFVKFNRNDGIRNDFFVISASHVLPDGRMIFGASESMVVFDPAAIKINTSYPVVNITDFKVSNRSLSLDSLFRLPTIDLRHNQNSISIDVSTMSYNTAYAVKYKLDGLDNEWKIADMSKQLIYPYLPPGSYQFQANSVNAEGEEGINPLVLNISVETPFWKTKWFYGLLALAIGFIFFWLDKIRMQRKEMVHKMRSNIATSLHGEVNMALNQINILSEMAKIKANSDPQKSTEFIDQIHSKSHNMIIAMDDMLWSISPENDSMVKTVERMREYIDALNSRHNSGIEIFVDERVKSLQLDMKYRHEAFLLFKDSILGLVKACASKCMIHLTIEKSNLVYTMQFNTKCCDIQQLNSLKYRQELVQRADATSTMVRMHMLDNNSILELKIPIVR
ncbi:hypothetical protein DHD05_05900 [Arenibacter sp. N53]|uniref:ligand-binding sensor domain-containing protein n=1 Tax=Arenibacter TaxID=178469 RepID=UPI000CD3C84E|nr:MULTISPECIES: two-component regulator propeller domain-containing protein [Arenibacter]MCM4151120.1 hypothetical protein [Arenibacter sp. N53]